MSKKAFFPLGGDFVENSWICCESHPAEWQSALLAECHQQTTSLRYGGGPCGLAFPYQYCFAHIQCFHGWRFLAAAPKNISVSIYLGCREVRFFRLAALFCKK
jgi:hypothetical protein